MFWNNWDSAIAIVMGVFLPIILLAGRGGASTSDQISCYDKSGGKNVNIDGRCYDEKDERVGGSHVQIVHEGGKVDFAGSIKERE